MDMSESMQEAMLRSNLDTSGAGDVRKEVPLHVLPTSSLLPVNSPLASFKSLQRVLYEEERAAYYQSVQQNMRFSINLFHTLIIEILVLKLLLFLL
jgi:BRCA1/BRCA2-containing complex subunit 3